MKKFITLTLITSILALTSCGDKITEKSNNDSSADNNKSESEIISDSERQTSEELSVEKSEETTTQERFYDFSGLNMYEPDDMIMLAFTNIGHYIWGYDYETEEKLNYAIVIDGMNYYDFSDPYGLDDVWEILHDQCESNIECIYQNIFKFYDAEVNATEKVDFLGAEFIRSTGIIPFETYDDERIEINYAAYYGILDFPAYHSFPEYKSVPFMWIAFSDSDSDEIKAEMEKIVDDVAENASWISD